MIWFMNVLAVIHLEPSMSFSKLQWKKFDIAGKKIIVKGIQDKNSVA